MKTKINSKLSKVPIVLICMILSVVVVGTAQAATKTFTQVKPQANVQTKAPIDPAVAKQNFQDMLTLRVAEYQAFLTNMPASLSLADQQTLKTELNTSISNIQNALSNINSTSTKPRLAESDTLIAYKISLLTQMFRTNLVHKAMSTSTKALAKATRAANISTFTPHARLSVQEMKNDFLRNFALSTTTVVSSDLVEQVINATSTRVLGDLSHQVIQNLSENRMAASVAPTANKSSILSGLKSLLHL